MTKSKRKSPTKNNSTIKQSVDWLQVARLMLISRTIDQIEEEELAPKGTINYQFSSKGHELAQILLGLHLDHPHDAATVYYRSRPLMLALGLEPVEAFAADMARIGSPSEGRDVGVVYSMPPRNGATVLPSSGDVGAQYTPAAGWAQAITYHSETLKNKSWNRALAVALGGDGSVATNGFWAALTIATTLELPMLFFIEDNGYGISVPKDFQTPGGNIAENLASFKNLTILTGSGTEPQECAELVAKSVNAVRAGTGPVLLKLDVPRLQGHTFGEDQTAYKTDAQLKAEAQNDPLLAIEKFMEGQLDWQKLKAEIDTEIRAALKKASALGAPKKGSSQDYLFHNSSQQQVVQVPPEFSRPPLGESDAPETKGPRINMSEAIRQTMELELEANPNLLIFGEDVGPRGGVHRVTLDLQSKFGENRVFDTSLSEEGIIGRAVGLALAGLSPLPEIQFRKYADPATEQINDLGWLRWRTAGKFEAPVVVRIPVGHSKKTGDPWHSVSAEAIYAHSLGWRIAMPSNAADAAGLLRSALRGHDPTLFLEHRALLDTPSARQPYPGDEFGLQYGKANRIQTGDALTVISWGDMLHRCVEAAQNLEGIEIIDLRTIIPWDKAMIERSVKKTGKCLIAHEDAITSGFGAEISATLTETCFTFLDAPIMRVATKDIPIPYNTELMQEVIPTVEDLSKALQRLLNW
jgi:2-oxoisovalerate dehydrogenase E1 component